MKDSCEVLGRTVRIVAIPDGELCKIADTEECLGLFKDDTIYIATSLTGDRKLRVFRHEYAHAILCISGITNLLEEKLEETLCDLLENFDVPSL